MADSVERRLLITFALILCFILCSSVLLLRHPSDVPQNPPPPLVLPPDVDPTAAKIAEALHSRGNYSSMIPELISKFNPDCLSGGGGVTIFVPTDQSEYHVCGSERPGVRIVRSRVDRAAFGSSGGLTNGSVLETWCDGGGEIRVEESAAAEKGYLHAEVVDWNLYDGDGGRVIVHGIDGELRSHNLVAAVGKFAVSGLVKPRRKDAAGDELESLCRGPWQDQVMAPRTVDGYREAFIRRVDGLPVPLWGM
ncbi:unnamed protein product [Linum tenue]|uniref:Uncharacterized protein n=1 Tax=Linum tenue TaxID=586396 RepID=A0AAV0L0D9_9ROSI|nr:unnamed protein product [Linum tenue]